MEGTTLPRGDVEAAVRALYGDAAKLVDYQVTPATSQGFSSFILTVKAQVKLPEQGSGDPEQDSAPHHASFVAKCMPQVASQLAVVAENDIFEREVLFFNQAVPRLKTKCENLPIVTHFNARTGVIIMEDLTELGFELIAKTMKEVGNNKMEFSHVKLIMEKLAQLHAASTDQDWLKILPYLHKDNVLETPTSPFITWFRKARAAYASLLLEYHPQADRKISEWLRSEKSFETMIKFVKPNPNSLNILCHGDFWINNIMFKLDSTNAPIDVKFIDFQMCKFVPPSRDILNLLYLCKDKMFRDKHESELLRIYVNSFNNTLGYEKIKLDEFTSEYNSSRLFGVFMGMVLGSMNCMPDLYPGPGETMTQQMYEAMLSGRHFEEMSARCRENPHFDVTARDIVDELLKETVKFM